jgi:hypothetical protein
MELYTIVHYPANQRMNNEKHIDSLPIVASARHPYRKPSQASNNTCNTTQHKRRSTTGSGTFDSRRSYPRTPTRSLRLLRATHTHRPPFPARHAATARNQQCLDDVDGHSDQGPSR